MAPPPKGFDDILPAGESPRAPAGAVGSQGGAQPPAQGSGGGAAPPHRRPPPPPPTQGAPAAGSGAAQAPQTGTAKGEGGRAAAATATQARPFAAKPPPPGSAAEPGQAPASDRRILGRYVGPFPWLGWKQLFFPILFVVLIGVSVAVLTSVGHSSIEPPSTTFRPIPIVFVFSVQSGTITRTSGANVQITMKGSAPTTLSYGGPSSLSLLQATVNSTADVVQKWQTYQFAQSPPYGAIVPSTPSQAATAVGVDISSIVYDGATQVLTVVGSLAGGIGAVSTLPGGFTVANLYVDTANGTTVGGCIIAPGTSCAGGGGNSFIGQNFAYAQLSGSNFSAADLTSADLASANFSGAKLANANFDQANLTNANLSFANVDSANFSDAVLADASLYSVGGSGVIMRGANMTGANLAAVNLSGGDLSSADLAGATSKSAKLTDVNLTDANLTNANFAETDLSGVNFTNANLTNADFHNSNTINANFTGAFFCNTTMPDGSTANPGC